MVWWPLNSRECVGGPSGACFTSILVSLRVRMAWDGWMPRRTNSSSGMKSPSATVQTMGGPMPSFSVRTALARASRTRGFRRMGACKANVLCADASGDEPAPSSTGAALASSPAGGGISDNWGCTGADVGADGALAVQPRLAPAVA
jgi:hypothetical protein